MKTYRFLMILALSLATMCVLAGTASALTNPGFGIIVVVCAGIGLVLTLSGLAFCWARTIRSLEDISKKLRSSSPENINLKSIAPVEMLIESIKAQSLEAACRTKELEKQIAEYNLELQLLLKEKKNIESIIYSIRDAVIVTDDYERLITANAAAERLFDFRFDPDNLKSLDEVAVDNNFVKIIRQSRQSKQLHVKREISFKNDSEYKIFDCIVSCMKDSDGNVGGVVAVLHDITKEKQISQMKNDFVSHVSHELKTPLASINAYAEMLVDGEAEDQETIQQFCGIIQNQAQRLNRLIEDILNISRIESGLVKVNKNTFSLAIVIQEAAKMIESYAAEKNITVNVPAPIIYDQINADKDMMSQVIINLLSNAVKYTNEGGSITIKTEVNEADSVVNVRVTDTGVGIPPEDVDHVFDKFYRVEENKKVAKGTGLGLNLAQQIIEKVHNGRIFVTSEPGKGSTFGFDIPLAYSQKEEVA